MSRLNNNRRSSAGLTRNSGEKTPLLNSIAMSQSIMTNKNPANTVAGVGWGVATFLLVNTALGAGMLNYPYAYNQIGGVLMATLMQAILLIFITSTMIILVYCADFNQDNTYHDVLLSMCGKRAQQLSALSILLTCYGINITFLVIIGDQYDRIFYSLLPGYTEDAWFLDRKFTIFMTSIIFIWPMCYAQRLDFLRHASILGMFAMLYVAFLTVYEHFVLDNATIAAALSKSNLEAIKMQMKANQTIPDHKMMTTAYSLANTTWSSPELNKPVKWFQPLAVIPILCFAYQTHEVIVPVYACMKERIIGKFIKATIFSLFLLFLLYNLVGAFGYLTFGKDVPADIMSLYDGKDPIVVVGIVALVVKFVTTYPPLMFCGRSAIDGLYAEIRQLSAEEFKASENTRRTVISTIWFFTTVALAAFAPDISVTLQLLGSMASINVFVFPGICLVSLTRRLRRARYSLLVDENDTLANGPNQQRAKDYYLISGSYFGALKKSATANSLASRPLIGGCSATTYNNNNCNEQSLLDSGNCHWNSRFKATFASLVELENNTDSDCQASSSRDSGTHESNFATINGSGEHSPRPRHDQLQNGYGSMMQPLGHNETMERVLANCNNSTHDQQNGHNRSAVDRPMNDSYNDYSDCGQTVYRNQNHGCDMIDSAPTNIGHKSHHNSYTMPSYKTTYNLVPELSFDTPSNPNTNQKDSFPDVSMSMANNSTSNPCCNSLYERLSHRQNHRQSNQACSPMNRSTTDSLVDRLGFSMAPSTVAQIGISRCTGIGLYLFSALLILFGMFIFILELVDVFGFLS